MTHLHIGVHTTNFVSTLCVYHSFKNETGFALIIKCSCHRNIIHVFFSFKGLHVEVSDTLSFKNLNRKSFFCTKLLEIGS